MTSEGVVVNALSTHFSIICHWRDTIRGVQIRAGAVRIYIYVYIYMYGGTYVIIVAHAAHT